MNLEGKFLQMTRAQARAQGLSKTLWQTSSERDPDNPNKMIPSIDQNRLSEPILVPLTTVYGR